MDTSILQTPATPAGKVDVSAIRKQGAATAKASSLFTSCLKQTLSSPEHSGSPAEQPADAATPPADGELIAQGAVNNLLIALTAVPTLVPLVPADADDTLVATPVAAATPQSGSMPLLTEVVQQQNPVGQPAAAASAVSPLPVADSSSPPTADSQAPLAVDHRNRVASRLLPDAKQPAAASPDVLPAVNLQAKLDGVVVTAAPPALPAMPQPAPQLPETVTQPPAPQPDAKTLNGVTLAVSEQMQPTPVNLKELVPAKQLQMPAEEQDMAETVEPIDGAVAPPQSAMNPSSRETKEGPAFGDTLAGQGLANGPHASAKPAEAVFDTADAVPQPAPDQYGVIRQIVDRARLYLRPGNQSEMVLQLQPEHLGELTVKVSVTSGMVNAAFHSDNPEVRQVIEAALPQLRQDLTQQGIKLDNVGVFSGSEQFFDNSQHPAQQQPIPLRRNRRELLQAVEAAETAAVTATDGVDYRI